MSGSATFATDEVQVRDRRDHDEADEDVSSRAPWCARAHLTRRVVAVIESAHAAPIIARWRSRGRPERPPPLHTLRPQMPSALAFAAANSSSVRIPAACIWRELLHLRHGVVLGRSGRGRLPAAERLPDPARTRPAVLDPARRPPRWRFFAPVMGGTADNDRGADDSYTSASHHLEISSSPSGVRLRSSASSRASWTTSCGIRSNATRTPPASRIAWATLRAHTFSQIRVPPTSSARDPPPRR